MLIDKNINSSNDIARSHLINQLRAALNAAEGGHDEVTIMYEGTEVTWNFSDGEFFAIG